MSEHYSENYLRERCTGFLHEMENKKGSLIFDSLIEKQIPSFDPKEVHFGRVLGKGAFCTVSTLQAVNNRHHDDGEDKQHRDVEQEQYHQQLHPRNFSSTESEENNFFKITQTREFICKHFIRDGQFRYAIKKLSPNLYSVHSDEPQHFMCGVMDLATEVKFLSVLHHPHIIKMRAMANVDYCSKDFFILIDRLDLTLGKQLQLWKNEVPHGFGPRVKKRRDNFYAKRLTVGLDICSALEYLHNKRIVYRDLKPDNIGFDVRGDVKIFDFGLACELNEKRRVARTDTYLLTTDTGSPRYMAPEVFKGLPYNEKCDIYSFGLILWQCLKMTPPFNSYNLKRMKERVYKGKDVPKLDSRWNSKIKGLLSNMFQRKFEERYTCREIATILREEIDRAGGEVFSELDTSNRTEKSLIGFMDISQ